MAARRALRTGGPAFVLELYLLGLLDLLFLPLLLLLLLAAGRLCSGSISCRLSAGCGFVHVAQDLVQVCQLGAKPLEIGSGGIARTLCLVYFTAEVGVVGVELLKLAPEVELVDLVGLLLVPLLLLVDFLSETLDLALEGSSLLGDLSQHGAELVLIVLPDSLIDAVVGLGLQFLQSAQAVG
jgi:hypothetical protein